MSLPRNKEWLCFFGLHVKTATILIGIWHLCLNVLALSVLTVIVRNPAMVQELHGTSNHEELSDPQVHPALPTPLSKIEPPGSYKDHDLNYQHMDMSGLMYLCLIVISGMLVYGALKGRRSYLLPFFCLQLFDFAITTLTAANFLTFHRILENQKLPWRDELREMSPQTLSIVILVAFVALVMIKAYAIGIVWRCYKYLTLQSQNMSTMLPYLIPETNAGVTANGRMERDYNSLLPDYDEVIAQSLKQVPPPSYSMSMAMSVNGHVILENRPESQSTQELASADTTVPPAYDDVRDSGESSATPRTTTQVS